MVFTHDDRSDRTVVLADGRTLGYCELGDPDGYPILNDHGGLLCRFDVELAHDEARQLGVRIISPDRPGVATSDDKPDRDTLDWGDDVDELLTALEVDECAAMGWSMGGQYTLAVARRCGSRVRAAAVIAGCLPLDDEATFAELNPMDQRLTRLSQNHPQAARAEFAALRGLERHLPHRMAKVTSRGWPASDRDLTIRHADWMSAAMVEAMRRADGMVGEYRAWARPWRFELGAVDTPVTVWQGTEDPLVPHAWGRRMAEAIPGAALHELEGHGHMIGVSHRTEVMRTLLEQVGRTPS